MRMISMLLLAPIALVAVAGRPQPRAVSDLAANDLAGEWRAQLQFTSGAFASIKDLDSALALFGRPRPGDRFNQAPRRAP